MPTHLRLLVTAAVIFIVLLLVGVAQARSVWYPQATLSASDGQAGFGFGQAIAADQDTIAVSSGYKGRGGAVYIFVRSGSTWVQQAQLFDTQTHSLFGTSVALQGDTLVVTAPKADIPHPPDRFSKGAAYIYTRTGSSWNRQAMLVPSEPYSGYWFGNSVAIDGNAVVIGQNQAAHVFERNPETGIWSYTTKLISQTALDSRVYIRKPGFGPVVAISNNTIAVGGTGGAFLFVRNSQTGTWGLNMK